MGREKITANMSGIDMIQIMSENNPGALTIVMRMLSNSDLASSLLLCDSFDIRGTHLYVLFNNCCNNDTNKFKRTLTMFKSGVFTQSEIDDNLELDNPIPFIDDNLGIDNLPSYYEPFTDKHPKWKEFCLKNRKVFLEKLSEAKKVAAQDTKKGLN